MQMGKIRESMLRMREQMHKIMQTSDAKGGKMDGSMQGKHSVTRRTAFAKCFPAINSDRYLYQN